MKKCVFCGSQLEEDSTYCSYCGKKIEYPTCPRCGTILEEESLFCSKCGIRLQDTPEETLRPGTGAQEVDSTQESNSLWNVLFGIGIVLLLAGGLFAYSYFKRMSVNEDSTPITNANNMEPSYEEYVNTGISNMEPSYEEYVNTDINNMEPSYEEYVNTDINNDWNLSGYMERDGTRYPIVITFHQQGDYYSDCIYKNVTYGGKIKMSVHINESSLCFEGRDGNKKFVMKLDPNEYDKGWDGYSTIGEQTLFTHLEE